MIAVATASPTSPAPNASLVRRGTFSLVSASLSADIPTGRCGDFECQRCSTAFPAPASPARCVNQQREQPLMS